MRFEEWWMENEFSPMIYGEMEVAYNAGRESAQQELKPEPVKTETRTYKCWDAGRTLLWDDRINQGSIPSHWRRVPSEDKTVEVVL